MTGAAVAGVPAAVDAAVVGGGIAGLMAAVRCAQAGLATVVLERQPDDRYLCNSRLTGGIFHIAAQPLLSAPDALLRHIEQATEGAARPDLARAVAGDAARAVRWLQAQGMRFIKGGPAGWQDFVLAPPALHVIGRPWEGRGGDVLLRLLESRLVEAGGRLLRGHRALRLTIDASGACRGLEGQTQAGGAFGIAARAVVIADGGFQADAEAVARHLCARPERLVQRNARTGLGDGLRMAQEAGCALVGLDRFYGHVLSRDALRSDRLWPYPWVDELARASMVVGPDARRFVDEGRGGVHVANAVAALDDPASAVVVADAAAWDGPARERALSTNPFLERAGGTVLRADSLPELARAAGLPAEALTDEVGRYNAALAAGRLAALDPPRSHEKYPALPVASAPFVAIPVAAGITYTMGGIAIDAEARALRPDGEPIAGLWAAGSTTGGLEGGPHAGYVGGLCKASVTALRAAEAIIRDGTVGAAEPGAVRGAAGLPTH